MTFPSHLGFNSSSSSASLFSSALGLLNLGLIDIWGQIILCWRGGCAVPCKMFSSMPGLYMLDASGTHPPKAVMIKSVPKIVKVTWGWSLSSGEPPVQLILFFCTGLSTA